MKKKVSVFLLLIGVLVFGGCSGNFVKTDVSSLAYLQDNSRENISSNLKMVAEEIKGVSFEAVINVKGKEFIVDGEIIVRDDLDGSLFHLKYKDNDLYFKNGNLYLSYMHKNTNVVVKDSIGDFVNEILIILKDKGINVKEEKVYDALNNKWLQDINFDKISKFVKKDDEGYLVKYKNLEVSLDQHYLPRFMDFNKNDISAKISFKYNPVKISVPVGYDVISIDIEFLKDLLKVDNMSQLIK